MLIIRLMLSILLFVPLVLMFGVFTILYVLSFYPITFILCTFWGEYDTFKELNNLTKFLLGCPIALCMSPWMYLFTPDENSKLLEWFNNFMEGKYL